MASKSKTSKKLSASLSEEQIKFWLANTKLSRENLLEWYDSFKQMAASSDKLNKENFAKFYEKLKPSKGDSQTFNKLVFNAFDKDNSGSIDFHEFIVAFNILGDGDVNERLNLMFDIYDINKDNIIDRQEIETLIKAILKMNKKQLVGDQTMDTKIDEIFDKLDSNENEKISREEFVSNCASNVFLRDILAP